MRYLFITVVISAGVLISGEQARTPAENAIEAAKQQIAKASDKPDGYNALALALARRARETADGSFYDQAEAAVAKSLELSKDNFEALKMRTWILLGKHQFAEALALAKQLNKRTPDDVMVYGFLTDAHAELGNYKEAEEAAQWMLDMSRGGIPALTRAAYLRELFGDIEGALELMAQAYGRIDPSQTEDRAWTLVQIGYLLTLQARYEPAEAALKQAAALMPDYHYALAAMAKLRTAEGKHHEAAQLLRKRYSLAPHPENLFDLGVALYRAGGRDEARRTLAAFEQAALKESEGWDNANRELITYYVEYAKDPKAALGIAEREISRRQDVATRQAYAWALHHAGETAKAKQQIEIALAVGSADPELKLRASVIQKSAE